jgi:hypothetical protein
MAGWCSDSKMNIEDCPIPHDHLWAFSFFNGMYQIALAASSEINRVLNFADNQSGARARTYGYANGFRDGLNEALNDSRLER